MEKARKENHFPKRRRSRAPVRRLDDQLDPGAVPLPETGRVWHLLIFTDAAGSRLVVTMAADIEAKRHRLTTPLLRGVTRGHGAGRLVYWESYGCRHTAFARLKRVARWPHTEKRRLVEAANPSWVPLGESGKPFAGKEEDPSFSPAEDG